MLHNIGLSVQGLHWLKMCILHKRYILYVHTYTIPSYHNDLPSHGTYVALLYYSIFRAAVTDTLLPAPFNMATIKRREAYALTTTLQDCIHQYIQEESVSWMANNVVYMYIYIHVTRVVVVNHEALCTM